MVKAFALMAVQMASEPGKLNDDGKVVKAAKIVEHKPGSVFDVDQDTFDELAAEGAVRKAERAEVVAAGQDGAEARKSGGQGSQDPLDTMTKEQLLEEAEKRGVEVKPAMSKAEILAALKAEA